MAKTRQQKQEVIKNIENKIDSSNAIVFSAFDQVTVNEDQKLRSELRKQDVSYEIVKKTLLQKVLQQKEVSGFEENIFNRNISMTASEDEVSGAKLVAEFAKDKEGYKIIGGILNNEWVDGEKIEALAKLPSKEELIAKTIGTIKAPLSGFVNVLAGNLRGLVNTLNAIKDQKEV
jgi:large subunit ribosomal protein L10